ncbi:MAG TPA: hypothetical protein VMG30_10950 [Acidobacteriota bacterium]|nr:hypothetical protein [Acidobacteriota bacterium]
MKIAKWCVMGMGILLVLAILAALVSNMIFGYQLRKTLSRLQAEGRPTTLAEFRPAPIPADQNAAPLLEKASSLLTNKPVPTAIQELSKLNQELSKPEYQNPTLGLRGFLGNKRDMLMGLIEEPDNKALFAILSEAAHKPKYNAQLEYEKAPAFRVPSFLTTRQLLGFLVLKAEAAAYEGNGEGAGQVLLDGFRLAGLLKQEPLMIQLLMSLASDGILINGLYRITNDVDLPADTLQSLETELKGHMDAVAYVRAMDEERVMTALVGYQILLNGTYRDIRVVVDTIPPPIAWLYGKSGLLHRDMNVFLTLQANIQDKCRMPSDKVIASMRRNPIEKQIPAFCPLSRIMLQPSEPILNTKAQSEAMLQVTRVGLALKQYKKANGAYPDNLVQLTPSYLDELPEDPCSGNSLLYRKEGGGFLLYSVGRDLQDNQGAQFNLKFPSAPYDIVWKTIR